MAPALPGIPLNLADPSSSTIYRAARFFNRADAERAIATRSGKRDANCQFAAIFGQRAEEVVYRQNRRAFFRVTQEKPAPKNLHPLTRRNDIDMVWLDHHAVFDLANRHRRMRCEQLDHLTAMSRREMLNDYESRTALCRHRREKAWAAAATCLRRPKPHT